MYNDMYNYMYNDKRIRQSELLQLILLDNLYAESGSNRIVFQGGTALRWIYGGRRFSEDLDFVTNLSKRELDKVLTRSFQKAQKACIAQFSLGQSEYKEKGDRKQATRIFFIYRPQKQRERIAVKLEFESLQTGQIPEYQRFILTDLPLVSGLISTGALALPYSSSIILVETPEEILTDKIRALYERKYLKGRDIYDLWWIRRKLGVTTTWSHVQNKLNMYEVPFIPGREAGYFFTAESTAHTVDALKRDLPRFLPPDILSLYQETNFDDFIVALREITSTLLNQGMKW